MGTHTLEETATNVDIEAVGEVISQIQQTRRYVVHFLRIINGWHVQVDEPNQTVLVHGIDVGQFHCEKNMVVLAEQNEWIKCLTYSKEQYSWVLGYRHVT